MVARMWHSEKLTDQARRRLTGGTMVSSQSSASSSLWWTLLMDRLGQARCPTHSPWHFLIGCPQVSSLVATTSNHNSASSTVFAVRWHHKIRKIGLMFIEEFLRSRAQRWSISTGHSSKRPLLTSRLMSEVRLEDFLAWVLRSATRKSSLRKASTI